MSIFRLLLIIVTCITALKLGINTRYADLHQWDERFHALVAKNLAENPAKPILLDALVTEQDQNWDRSHVWLAKPPLALWGMAGSIKVFGANEWAVRLPSIIYFVASVWLTFFIGRRLYGEKVGAIAGILYCMNGLLYNIYSGQLAGDHVDALFLLLCQTSIWCLLQYQRYLKIKYLVYIGICIGLAFLTKWTMATFPFLIVIVYLFTQRSSIPSFGKNVGTVSILAIMVGLPWLIYIYNQFPTETITMLSNMVMPTYSVIQDHAGGPFYYLNAIRIYIHEIIYIPLVLLGVRLWYKRRDAYVLLAIWIFFPLVILSIFSTKREVYMLMSATPMFISVAWFVRFVMIIYRSKIGKLGMIALVSFIFLLPLRTYMERAKPWEISFAKPSYRVELEQLLAETHIPKDSIILYRDVNYCQIQFFYGIKSHPWIDNQTSDKLRDQGYHLYERIDGKYVKR